MRAGGGSPGGGVPDGWGEQHAGGRGGDAGTLQPTAPLPSYHPGEQVVVIQGRSAGVTGTLVDVNHRTTEAVVRVSGKVDPQGGYGGAGGGQGRYGGSGGVAGSAPVVPGSLLHVETAHLRHHFPVNTVVVVTAGPHEGVWGSVEWETPTGGAVVRSEDHPEQLVEVLLGELESANRYVPVGGAGEKGRMGKGVEQGELVYVRVRGDGGMAEGVVFVVQRTARHVLGLRCDNTLVRVTPREVLGRVTHAPQSFRDRRNQVVKRGEDVKLEVRSGVQEGELVATVRQIYLDTVFLQSPEKKSNSGYFADSRLQVAGVGHKRERTDRSGKGDLKKLARRE